MSKSDSRSRHTESQLVTVLNRIADYGIAGVLFVAPLAMAGRYAPGRLLLAIIVGITAIAWFAARIADRRDEVRWLWTGAEWLALCAILLVIGQILPWSPSTLATLSPELPWILPMHTVDAAAADAATQPAFSSWEFVSLTPHATRGGLAMTVVYVMLFFVVLQRVRRKADVEHLLKAVAVAGVFMAGLGILQYLFGNGEFLGFINHPSRDTLTGVKGTFANENHFAHFLALTLGPLLWWLVKEQHDSANAVESKPAFGISGRKTNFSHHQVLLCFGIGIVFVAGLLTYSRGGLLVMTLAGIITTALFVYQRRVGKKSVVAMCSVALVAALAVFIHGQEILVREIGTLQDVTIESLDKDQGRRKIWTAVLSAAPDFAILGSGVGSHRNVYPQYFSNQSSVQYTHAESGYLNLLLETGGPGLGLLLVGIGLGCYWIGFALVKSEQDDIQFMAVPLVASAAISILHASFDFNWYIPANMSVTLIVVALGARLWDLSLDRETQQRKYIAKPSMWGLAVAVVFMSAFAISHYVGPARGLPAWHEFRAWSLASNGPGAGRQRTLGKVDVTDPDTVARMIQLLDETIEYDPGHGRAHVRMASMCLRQFELLQATSENAMTLPQIRDAALTSGFESHEAMSEWVSRVVGDNRVYLDRVLWHCKQGLRTTPTEGNGYLYLSEVAFLDPALAGTEYELMRQAYAVRPYDAAIQFAFGRQRLLAGENEPALELWKSAFARGDSVRKRVIAAVGFQAPPQEIVDIFQPGLEGLRDLFEYYRRRSFEPQMRFIGDKFVVELEKQAKLMSGETAGKLWFDAQFVHATLGNVEQAARAAKNAVMADPGDYRNHFACALRMRDCGRFEEAIKDFRWCASRRPEDPVLPKVIAEMKSQARLAEAMSAKSIESNRLQRR